MEHLPPGYIRLLAKLDEVGRKVFGDDRRGAKALELREKADHLDPSRICRAPEPINLLGSPWTSNTATKHLE